MGIWAVRRVPSYGTLCPYLLTPPFGLLPLLAASQPCFCLLQTEVDWDAGPTDDANVEANLPGPVRLGKWASIFVIVFVSSGSFSEPKDSGQDLVQYLVDVLWVLLLWHITAWLEIQNRNRLLAAKGLQVTLLMLFAKGFGNLSQFYGHTMSRMDAEDKYRDSPPPISSSSGDEELKSIGGVGNGLLTKKEIKKNDRGVSKEPNKERKLNEKVFLTTKTFITTYDT
ncbi:hypothetical protein Tco_1044219 [Tanacetum coccineum]|uniref:PIN-like protein n=1 Tax=Tanacetum coccineum TaxID=301880 RepID=A0ABQ5GQI0_9ASTR